MTHFLSFFLSFSLFHMDSSVSPIIYPSFSFTNSIHPYFILPPPLYPDALLHISSPSFLLFPLLLHFTFHLSLSWSVIHFSLLYYLIPMPTTPTSNFILCSISLNFFHPPHSLLFPCSFTLLLAFSPYIQKPHGGSASNLHMLGSPFVLLVQGPHNAVFSAQDPLSADLIR